MISISRDDIASRKQTALKRILILLGILCILLMNQTTTAGNGLFFKILATGIPDNLSITLCLNGKGPLSCQNYAVSALNLNISTTIPNHVYPSVGIKVNNPGYFLSGCTPISNGYCLFSASNTKPANIIINTTYTIAATSGANGTITPQGFIKINGGGSQQFTATPAANYGVHQWLLDGVPVQTAGSTYTLSNVTANHTVEVTFTQATLTPNISSLALSVHCPSGPTSGCVYSNPALTGSSRQITFTNHGTISANNVSVVSSGFPSGTSISSSTCSGTLRTMDSCIITITPGTVASSDCTSGIAPTSGSVMVTADEAVSTLVNVIVLSYSCIYQSGYLYSVNDETPNTGSIGGKVVTMSNQATENSPGIIWSANSLGNYDGGISIWGIDDTSTVSSPSPNASSTDPATNYPGQSNCNGASDGACNTKNINIYYSTIATPPPHLSSYAAGLCKATINDYSDWYLPAICEMGPDAGSLICTSPPLMHLEQNMVDNLPVLLDNCTGAMCLSGEYWSSTELSGNPVDIAWAECFTPNGGSTQCVEGKNETLGVRCSRALTF
ncbi:InlB B-repeat-containing protein [Legionella fallonii]|uniref:Bacterial repeat domain-containing protein n=1 Tax=Legionella fallonii LLAP-10 TaxID=1212491 RepID=A0A098G419_9GAMM|nr:hypothetical protein [Legionella fallonii]CEG57222.1 conserved exported protein of unknown function [Legionella fallonii LLAP-10]